jgi:hypothetical protein
MATPDSKTEITVTPGKNKKVNNVIHFEDLLQKAREGVSDLVHKRSAVAAEHDEKLGLIQKLAGDLEPQLRALRAAAQKPASRRRNHESKQRKRVKGG